MTRSCSEGVKRSVMSGITTFLESFHHSERFLVNAGPLKMYFEFMILTRSIKSISYCQLKENKCTLYFQSLYWWPKTSLSFFFLAIVFFILHFFMFNCQCTLKIKESDKKQPWPKKRHWLKRINPTHTFFPFKSKHFSSTQWRFSCVPWFLNMVPKFVK